MFFFSIDKVQKITSPVLVIHGTEDEVIDFSHGLAIHERCPRTVEPLWVEGAGHNDVELYGQYLERLKQFISVDLAVNWRHEQEVDKDSSNIAHLDVAAEVETLLWSNIKKFMWPLSASSAVMA